MGIKSQIPNILTAGNLLCGCIGMVLVANGNLAAAPVAVLLAAVFDFFDGFAARMLKVSSDIGKELDSLADMVSFGVLPAVTVFVLLGGEDSPNYISYTAFLLAVFSALRLAKFNIDTRQTDKFIGVPTPANALFFTSLVWTAEVYPSVSSEYVLLGLVLLFSWLLVSPIELIALKFKHFGWKGNEPRYILIVIALAIAVIGGVHLLPVVVIAYIAVSIFANRLAEKSLSEP